MNMLKTTELKYLQIGINRRIQISFAITLIHVYILFSQINPRTYKGLGGGGGGVPLPSQVFFIFFLDDVNVSTQRFQ